MDKRIHVVRDECTAVWDAFWILLAITVAGMLGVGERNLTRTAVAPTTSSSFILGQVSPSIEPLASNYFTKDLAKGKFTYRNPHLKAVLHDHGKNNEEVWVDILKHGGSVQHLDFLTQNEKDVFKTFSEITPLSIVQQAGGRQKYIDITVIKYFNTSRCFGKGC